MNLILINQDNPRIPWNKGKLVGQKPPLKLQGVWTIRHRTRRSKGCLTRDGMLHMMFKLGQCRAEMARITGFRIPGEACHRNPIQRSR